MKELSPHDSMMLSLLEQSVSAEDAKRIVGTMSQDAHSIASKILKMKDARDLQQLGQALEPSAGGR